MASSPSRGADGLDLGRLTDVWKKRSEWESFKVFLAEMEPEGVDGSGRKLSLDRYATFLELYVQLHLAEERGTTTDEALRHLVVDIRKHPEDFFGMQRHLKVINKPMRTQVMANVRAVEKGERRGGKWVYQPVYTEVFNKLSYWTGSYHEKHTLQ